MSQKQEQIVYVVGSGQYERTHKGSYNGKKYHKEKDCSHLQKSQIPPTDKKLSVVERAMEPCKHCHESAQYRGEMEEKECDRCGETYKQLPDHLRSCSALR